VQPIDECFGCQKRMGEISTIYDSQEEQIIYFFIYFKLIYFFIVLISGAHLMTKQVVQPQRWLDNGHGMPII
jgi:hypothetical protein